MDEKLTKDNSNINAQMVHFKKINIFGNSNVGKSSLILSLTNYLNKDFKIEVKEEKKEEENIKQNSEEEENIPLPNLVEQIKRVNIPYNESTELYLNLYETKIDNIDFLKNHIDTLVIYSK